MKKRLLQIISLTLCVLMLAVAFVACGEKAEEKADVKEEQKEVQTEEKTEEKSEEKTEPEAVEAGLWKAAVYTEDKSFGEGAKEVKVEVKAEEKSVTFTLNTDKDNLADALLEYELISGDEGPYGIYIKLVNGISAVYETDGAYWSLSKDGEMLMTGADSTEISDGEHYEITYTK